MQIIKFLLNLFRRDTNKSTLYPENKKQIQTQSKLPPIKLYELNRPNYKYTEFYYSKEAKERGIDNTPKDQAVLSNLMKIADNCQILHLHLQEEFKTKDVVINIESGYRCEILNKIVKGSPTSLHKKGLAVDLTAYVKDKKIDLLVLAMAIVNCDINFDQILIEHEKGIVHFGLAEDEKKARKELKRAWIDGKEWKTKLIKKYA